MTAATHHLFPPIRRAGLPAAANRRGAALASILAAHAALAWGLLHLGAVVDGVVAPPAVTVTFVETARPPQAPQPLPTVAPARPVAPEPLAAPPVDVAVASATAWPTPAATVDRPAPAPAIASPVADPAQPAEPTAPAARAPAVLPPSALQYRVPPAPDYPRMARRAGETGTVLVRVLVDEAGQPRQAVVAQSSGFARLDDEARLAVLRARFQPPRVDGQAVSGWAVVPIRFDLGAA